LTQAEEEEVAAWVEDGADLARDGVVRFRRVDLRDRMAGRFGVYLHASSVSKLLHRLGYRASFQRGHCTRKPTLMRRRLLKFRRGTSSTRRPRRRQGDRDLVPR
jgi:hypothetical protein